MGRLQALKTPCLVTIIMVHYIILYYIIFSWSHGQQEARGRQAWGAGEPDGVVGGLYINIYYYIILYYIILFYMPSLCTADAEPGGAGEPDGSWEA